MRLKGKQLVGVLTLFVLAAPVWAHTHTATAYIIDTTTIAGTTLQPGQYELKVEDNGTQLQVLQNRKVVAQVPVQWIQLHNKAMDTQVVLNNNQITEVDFGGETQAVQITSH
jgi:hypothetical protein